MKSVNNEINDDDNYAYDVNEPDDGNDVTIMASPLIMN
jgi:hypothetical protein